MPSQNNAKPEKITKTKAKKIKDKLAKHFKNNAAMLDAVASCIDMTDISELVLTELGVDRKLELG